jgi:transposase-like protein
VSYSTDFGFGFSAFSVQRSDVLFGVCQHLRMENVPCQFLSRHVFRMFLFLRHGEPMKSSENLISIIKRYGTDERCRECLVHLRWPNGIVCPKCSSKKISRVYERGTFDCDNCRHQFSVTAGTMFHDSHLPLTTWFYVAYVMCESRNGVSANQIKRMFGISYKTAWYLCHRIRAAMVEVNKPKLKGIVEMDETYVGGRGHVRGRGSEHKEAVIGIRQRGGDLRFFHAEDVRSGTLEKYIRENISEDVDILMTDDLAHRGAARHLRKQYKHKTIRHKAGWYVQGDVHTNTIESAFSLLKRGVMSTWHRLSAKHLQAYCNEMCFRFNNRKNPYLFRDTLLKLIGSHNVEYKQLTAEQTAA